MLLFILVIIQERNNGNISIFIAMTDVSLMISRYRLENYLICLEILCLSSVCYGLYRDYDNG